jgi:hypothetical protein
MPYKLYQGMCMKKTTMLIILTALTMFAACKKDENVTINSPQSPNIEEIKTGVLDGVFNGNAWTFMSGRVKKDQFRPGRFVLDLWESTEAEPCKIFFPTSQRNLITSIPDTAGSFELGNETNVTFSSYSSANGSENLVATEGMIVIDEVTADSVKGKLLARFDGSNIVNGSFSLTMCK